jgi:TonB family protein
MPASGKSVGNPFTPPSKAKSEAANADAKTGGRDYSGKPSAVSTGGRSLRGISKVGTESRSSVLSMRHAATWSAVLHILSPIALTILTLLFLLVLSWIMHFNFWDLFKVKSPPQDLEFTLVRDTQAALPKKPLFKGNFNQRAGGKRNPHQVLKPVEDPNPSAPAHKASALKPTIQPQPMQQAVSPTPPQPKPPPTPTEKLETPPLPSPTVATSKTTKAPPSKDVGPVAHTAVASASAASEGPQIFSMGDATMTGQEAAAGSMSNPQGGDAANPGVDVAQDINFGPFMAELEKRIKRNWVPPRGAESRKVLLLFYLARDGRVLKVDTKESSGDDDADRAAIAAVEASAPFMAFPPQVKEDVLPVEFTFDYNVLNPKNAKQALKW